MGVSYNKLFKLLIDRRMTKKDLREAADISQSSVSLEVLVKICAALQVDIGDIMEVTVSE